MAKVNNYPGLPWYYYSNYPQPAKKIVNRKQKIKNGASTKGVDISVIEPGVVVWVDKKEVWDGWIRIMWVEGFNPIPVEWQKALEGKQPADREAWIDVSALAEIVVEPDPQPTGRKWTYKVTVEEVKE